MEFNQVKRMKIKDLKPHPKNPRVHPKSALDKLIKSIEKFGFTNPVLVSKDGFILAGHARCKAAEEAGIDEVPVIFLELEGADADAYLIADNRIQEETDWDVALLKDLIDDLKESNFDIEFTGFEPPELDEMFSQLHDKDVKEDDFDVDEALKEPAVSKLGDLWLLGRHRLICGDSTDEETYRVLMDEKKANLTVTDPPYNVAYEAKAGTIQNDDMKDKDFYNFLLSSFKNMFNVMENDASIYVFHADTEGLNFRKAFIDAGFYLSGVCIWAKQSLVLGRSPYQWKHEPILFGWRKDGRHRWYSDRKQSTIWNFDRPSKNDLHPTMKPVALCAYPIQNSSMSNCIVLDPFGGSGSTLIACEQTNRICHTIELDEKYTDVIVKRYINEVGTDKDVYLIRDGKKIKYSEVIKI
jgi:DNA modification methylase